MTSAIALNDAAMAVWIAWISHQEKMEVPEIRRPPLGTAAQADAKQCRRASKAFLKALRALPDTTPNVTQLLERVSQHVRSDIPSLTAIYAHPKAPRCDAGALALLFSANATRWYAPPGLGELVRLMVARGARADHGTPTDNPLLLAVRFASPAAVEALLAAGANPEGVEGSRLEATTHPLSLACAQGNAGCVKALLAAGAAPSNLHPSLQKPRSYKETGDWHHDRMLAGWKACAELVLASARSQRLEERLAVEAPSPPSNRPRL